MAPSPPRVTDLGLAERFVRALSAARDDEAAAEAVLHELAGELDAQLAVLWLLDPATGLLRWQHDWAGADDVSELRQVIRRLTFAPGVGLPGRVLDKQEPCWIDDVAADAHFPRADAALGAGMRSVVAGPLVSREGVMGVIEVFAGARREPNAEQMSAMLLAGQQLGAYLGRRRIEDRLRAVEESSASIVEAALDCIITMDHRGRVLDFNPAAEATFGYERDAAIGELLAELIIPPSLRDAHHRALSAYVEDRTPTILGRRLELVGMRADGSQFPVELTVTEVGNREPPVFAGFIRDITQRRSADEQIDQLLEREHAERLRAEDAERATREVAEVLQRSLLPPRLPAIPGLALGAVYRAGTAGWQVGGDFYDVFKVGPDRWAVAVGDVCGKGPRAAALTAKVRYGLRDAAMQHSRPSDVLAAVNAELLASVPGELVTVVFATVDLDEADPRCCLAVGGHPLPLRARSDGTVTTVGRHGALLGAVDRLRAHDVEFRLATGDVLLLYTDGVTEALMADGRLGEARLAELLAREQHAEPQQLVDRIDSAVLAARVPGAGDDAALVAVCAGSGCS